MHEEYLPEVVILSKALQEIRNFLCKLAWERCRDRILDHIHNIKCTEIRNRMLTRQSGWLLSKSLQAINAGEGVEKREPSYTVGGNAN